MNNAQLYAALGLIVDDNRQIVGIFNPASRLAFDVDLGDMFRLIRAAEDYESPEQ